MDDLLLNKLRQMVYNYFQLRVFKFVAALKKEESFFGTPLLIFY